MRKGFYHHSKAIKKLISKIKKGKPSPFRGHHQSEKSKDEISKKLKQISPSRNHKINIGIGVKKSWINLTNKRIKSLENGFGTKCYSNDGLFFLSLGECRCYYWIRDDVKEVVKIEKFGRIDFILALINGNKIALEYHPNHSIDKKTNDQYYKDRRRLLNELGYKDLKLIVMTSLSNKEKERIYNEVLKLC